MTRLKPFLLILLLVLIGWHISNDNRVRADMRVLLANQAGRIRMLKQVKTVSNLEQENEWLQDDNTRLRDSDKKAKRQLEEMRVLLRRLEARIGGSK